MSLHPLDVFPETIWTRIFEDAKRPWPSVRLGGHDCCYQPVLARLMAVHPALHELVGPVLYRECVVVDLEMFFVGLDGQTRQPEDSERFWTEAGQQLICERVSTVPPAPVLVPAVDLARDHGPSPCIAKRLSKRDLLGHVEVLHLATASLRKSPTGYSRFYGLEKAQTFNYLATRRGLEMFHRANTSSCASSGATSSASSNASSSESSAEPLGLLDKITLDLYHEPNYEYVVGPGHGDTPFARMVRHARNDLYDAFERFLAIVRPAWVCQHRASNHFCRWERGLHRDPVRARWEGRAWPSRFVSHDFRTPFRLPASCWCRRYAPPLGDDRDDRSAVSHLFQDVDFGCYYRGELWLRGARISRMGWPVFEMVLDEQDASRQEPSRRSRDADRTYQLIKDWVRPFPLGPVWVIDSGNEALSPWGSCGCPAAVET